MVRASTRSVVELVAVRPADQLPSAIDPEVLLERCLRRLGWEWPPSLRAYAAASQPPFGYRPCSAVDDNPGACSQPPDCWRSMITLAFTGLQKLFH